MDSVKNGGRGWEVGMRRVVWVVVVVVWKGVEEGGWEK